MTRFRPCIDLHSGQVKQIVGGTLSNVPADLKTNYISTLPAGHYAGLYQKHGLHGGHVVKLGPGNDGAAKEALGTWPGGLQVAGGITDENAQYWIDQGADKVIITSFLFPEGQFSQQRLESVLAALGGDRSKLVLDLSCRKKDNTWFVAMNRWQTITEMEINQGASIPVTLRLLRPFRGCGANKGPETISFLEPYCSEFLVHAADVEGLQQGIDGDLVSKLAEWCTIPVTYAGGARSLQDLITVHESSQGRVDLTIGSALDIFGGSGVAFDECIQWNKEH